MIPGPESRCRASPAGDLRLDRAAVRSWRGEGTAGRGGKPKVATGLVCAPHRGGSRFGANRMNALLEEVGSRGRLSQMGLPDADRNTALVEQLPHGHRWLRAMGVELSLDDVRRLGVEAGAAGARSARSGRRFLVGLIRNIEVRSLDHAVTVVTGDHDGVDDAGGQQGALGR